MVGMPGEDKLIRSQQQFAEGIKGILEVLGNQLPSLVITVAPGNTLWQLAAMHLSDGQRWREIYAMNLDIVSKHQDQHHAVSGPDMIYPGAELRILTL